MAKVSLVIPPRWLFESVWGGNRAELVRLARVMLPYLGNPVWTSDGVNWTEFAPHPEAPYHWLAASLVPGCGQALVAITYFREREGRWVDVSTRMVSLVQGLADLEPAAKKAGIPLYRSEMLVVCLDRKGLSGLWQKRLEEGKVLDGTDL